MHANIPCLFAILLTASLVPVGSVQGGTRPTSSPGGFSNTHVFGDPAAYDTTGDWSRPLLDGPYAIGEREVDYLTSAHDGATTFPVILYRPVDAVTGAHVQAPVIAWATSKLGSNTDAPSLMDARVKATVGPDEAGATIDDGWDARPPERPFPAERTVYAQLVQNFVPHGYAVAIIPIRGTATSGGCSDVIGPAERSDMDQVATHLGTREGSAGSVGFIGISYDGGTAWMAAASGNPHVKTVVPIAGLADLLTYVFPNGTVGLYSGFAPVHHALNAVLPRADLLPERICPDVVDGLAATAAGHVVPERRPSGPLGALPTADFWVERDSRPLVEARYAGSVLLVHGLSDWNVEPNMVHPWIGRLNEDAVRVKQILGQWGHAYPDGNASRPGIAGADERWDWAEILLHWFDYWLKGDWTVDLGPVAQVQDSSGQWRSEDSWPPQRARPTTFHLEPGRVLTEAPARCSPHGPLPGFADSSCAVEYVVGVDPHAQPEELSEPLTPPRALPPACALCARFESPVLAQELRFAGVPKVRLTVVPSGPAEIHAGLYVLDPDGDARRVGRGQIDLHFADGSETFRPFVPGRPLEVAMQLQALDVVAPPGSRLVLDLSLGTYGSKVPGVPQSPTLVRAGDGASVLDLLTFDVRPNQCFDPPSRPGAHGADDPDGKDRCTEIEAGP